MNSTCRANNTSAPVYSPPAVVATPDAWLTAPRDSAPDTGMESTREEARLHRPRAIISCVASTYLPSAGMKVRFF